MGWWREGERDNIPLELCHLAWVKAADVCKNVSAVLWKKGESVREGEREKLNLRDGRKKKRGGNG